MNFRIREYQPGPQLRPFVECFWSGAFNIRADQDTSFQMVPNGCLELIIHLDDVRCKLPDANKWSQTPEYMLIGLLTETREVRFSDTVPVFTIRLRPEALFSLFNINGLEVLERYEDIFSLLGANFRDFCHTIREAPNDYEKINISEEYFLKLAASNGFMTGYVNKAAELMRKSGSLSISDLSYQLGISQRQLQRKFRETVGLRPKQYYQLTRINRVMRVLAQKRSLDLTSVAYYCGYFDQAHFIRDFKKITGMNPSIFNKNKESFITIPGQVGMDE